MSAQPIGRPRFWESVTLLLGAARRRSEARRKRQQELLNGRTKGKGTDWGALGFVLFVFFMLFIHGAAAFCVSLAVKAAQRADVEQKGKIVVSQGVVSWLDHNQSGPRKWLEHFSEASSNEKDDQASVIEFEADRIAEQYGGSVSEIKRHLYWTIRQSGTANLVSNDVATPGLSALGRSGRLAPFVGSIALLWWALMVTFQGEGLEMDVQRRRHPMWEWVLSHPVPPGAMFLAEMLSPIAANPTYWGAPLFVGIVYGLAYDPGLGICAALIVGVPITVALACLGKALETGVLLRCSVRSRGAIIGLMSWFGYTALMLFAAGALVFVSKLVTYSAGFLTWPGRLPWPWLGLFLGELPGGSLSFFYGVFACWVASALTAGSAVWFSVWATNRGLSGQFSAAVTSSSAQGKAKQVHFGKEPLYRKEFLWFSRDRSAIVQTLLIPLSIGGLQVFNLRGLLVHAQGAWNYLCGVAIFFGTFFLWVLGPKSLQSEGPALWIALTWPRGLESLLKAKAWLWSMISCGPVALVLLYAALLFPKDLWKIALVSVAWYFFARSMAEKAVTLVAVTKESGEREPIPKGRVWAAQLGMLTFAIGVVTGQWQMAIVGIVYSWITAAAMWQNFRARLPYLYDPWSEKLPTPPTLMHAMISISVLIEFSALLTGIVLAFGGRENLGVALALSYGSAAIVVSVVVSNFLSEREVKPHEIWCWRTEREQQAEEADSWARRFGLADRFAVSALLLGVGGGVALGFLARGYLILLQHLPAAAEILRQAQQQEESSPDLHLWYTIMAVGLAPFAEEYLFRGLLFRALDREWGGWYAVLGSAAFFAIYHPVVSWVPVFLVGVVNCIIFKKTRKLAPAVLLHMVYNAVVLT